MDKVTNYMDRMIAFKNGNQQFTQIWHGGKCVYDVFDSFRITESPLIEYCSSNEKYLDIFLNNIELKSVFAGHPKLFKIWVSNKDLISYFREIISDYPLAIDLICDFPNMAKLIVSKPFLYEQIVNDSDVLVVNSDVIYVEFKRTLSNPKVSVNYKVYKSAYGIFPSIHVGRIYVNGTNSGSSPSTLLYAIDETSDSFGKGQSFGFKSYLGRVTTITVDGTSIKAEDLQSLKEVNTDLQENLVSYVTVVNNGDLAKAYGHLDVFDSEGNIMERVRYFNTQDKIYRVRYSDANLSVVSGTIV